MSSSSGALVWDPASSIPTLIGSLLSLLATALVIVLWILARRKRRDFRYALILNLTVAEFFNSLNNSVSGIAAVARHRPLLPGTACKINGWAGQFSVQAVDFSILAITLVTLLTIQLRSSIIYASTTTKALICLSIWIVPLCTSLIAWFNDYYGPVSGNWCWIGKQHLRERYALNHGWRFAIFIISLCSYIYVFIYMSRRLRPQHKTNLSSTIPDDLDYEKLDNKTRDDAVLAGCGLTPRISVEIADTPSTDQPKGHRRAVSSFSFARVPQIDTSQPIHDNPPTPSPTDIPPETHVLVSLEERTPPHRARTAKPNPDREIWKMLLLNLYPVTYLILWSPGIANRIAEGMGHQVRVLVILQCSTQFIGFANAGVYVWKEHGRDVREWWTGVRGRTRGRVEDTTSLRSIQV